MITDDFAAAMVLTGLWLAFAGAVCLVAGWRVRFLRWPLIGSYIAAAAAVGLWLAAGTLRDRVVNETVAAGVAPGERPARPREPSADARPAHPHAAANVELAGGAFASGEHATSGRAAVVRLTSGKRVLTLTRFQTSAGPDLRVRLVPGAGRDGSAPGNIDLGALKGNRGDQQYALPAGVPVRAASVVIWCRAFSAEFGTAQLRAS